jgi:hypothetical protein
MPTRLALISALIVIALGSSALAANNQTVLQVMEAACPSMSAAASEAARGREEMKLANFAVSQPYFKRASRIAYECLQSTSGYSHDWIDWFYADYLFDSASWADKAADADSIVSIEMNNLAAGTKYSDVRAAALNLRATVRKDIERYSSP